MGKSFNCGYRDKKGNYSNAKSSKKKNGHKRFSDSENEEFKLKEKYNINFSRFK